MSLWQSGPLVQIEQGLDSSVSYQCNGLLDKAKISSENQIKKMESEYILTQPENEQMWKHIFF